MDQSAPAPLPDAGSDDSVGASGATSTTATSPDSVGAPGATSTTATSPDTTSSTTVAVAGNMAPPVAGVSTTTSQGTTANLSEKLAAVAQRKATVLGLVDPTIFIFIRRLRLIRSWLQPLPRV